MLFFILFGGQTLEVGGHAACDMPLSQGWLARENRQFGCGGVTRPPSFSREPPASAPSFPFL